MILPRGAQQTENSWGPNTEPWSTRNRRSRMGSGWWQTASYPPGRTGTNAKQCQKPPGRERVYEVAPDGQRCRMPLLGHQYHNALSIHGLQDVVVHPDETWLYAVMRLIYVLFSRPAGLSWFCKHVWETAAGVWPNVWSSVQGSHEYT